MGRLGIQTKLIALMGLVIGTFLCGLLLLHGSEEKQTSLLLEDKMKERAKFLTEFVNLFEEPLKTFAYDYSFWDEMVSFVGTGDSVWGYENVFISLTTYQVDAAWVYKSTGEKVYCTALPEKKSLLQDTLPEKVFSKLLGQKPFQHFFINCNLGPLEIRIAPVQPSSDNNRASTPEGFFVVGKLWNSEYIGRLQRAMDAEISIVNPDTDSAVADNTKKERPEGAFYFSQILPGPDGRPIAKLACKAESPLYNVLRDADHNRMTYTGLFAFGIMLVLLMSLRAWVSLPLKHIMECLQKGVHIPPESLRKAGIEFQKLGELISAFFFQRAKLESEITEHKKSKEALEDRENLLKSTLESTADGILVVDNNGNSTHWNERFREMWRIPRDIVETRDDDKLLQFVLGQLSDPDAFLSKVMELYQSSEVSLDTLDFSDGRVFERYSCPLIRDGKAWGRVWSFRDITQRKKAEQARLELQDKLDKARRMESLGLLAGGVAHDLNNMLGPVVGYSELLLRELPSESNAAAKVTKIAKSARDAAAVIQDLLALARRGRYDMHPMDINGVISSYMESAGFEHLREQCQGVIIQIDLAPAIGLIMGSEVHLGKIIMNLIANAFEAMPSGGILSIKTERARIENLLTGYQNIDKGDYAIVRVKDTGVGIAKEDIEKIFEPYFSKKKMGRSGSGLGLSVVYGIVKDHKGYYDVLSEPGKGTEFILYFPISDKAVLPAAPPSIKIDRGNETVLVVDDSLEQRELAEEIIASLGYEVYVAENGRQAVSIISQKSVDILVIDMIMEPDFDGLDTYREILEIYPNQKAVIVSGFSATDRVVEMQKLGAGDYVRKPYSIDILTRSLRKELNKTQSLAENRQ